MLSLVLVLAVLERPETLAELAAVCCLKLNERSGHVFISLMLDSCRIRFHNLEQTLPRTLQDVFA